MIRAEVIAEIAKIITIHSKDIELAEKDLDSATIDDKDDCLHTMIYELDCLKYEVIHFLADIDDTIKYYALVSDKKKRR